VGQQWKNKKMSKESKKQIINKTEFLDNAIMAYVRFNFTYRTRECVGIRPYPQYYRPLDTLDKSTHWTFGLCTELTQKCHWMII